MTKGVDHQLAAHGGRAGLRWQAEVHQPVRVAEFAIGGRPAGVRDAVRPGNAERQLPGRSVDRAARIGKAELRQQNIGGVPNLDRPGTADPASIKGLE